MADHSATGKVNDLDYYLGQPVHDEQQVDSICKELATIDLTKIDAQSDGLRLIRTYMKKCVAPNMKILKPFAVGGFFNIQDDDGGLQTPLHWIFYKDVDSFLRADVIKVIIRNGGNVSIKDEDGDNCLHFALSNVWDTAILEAILEGQPKPSPLVTARNEKGWSPMRILVSRSNNISDTLRH